MGCCASKCRKKALYNSLNEMEIDDDIFTFVQYGKTKQQNDIIIELQKVIPKEIICICWNYNYVYVDIDKFINDEEMFMDGWLFIGWKNWFIKNLNVRITI